MGMKKGDGINNNVNMNNGNNVIIINNKKVIQSHNSNNSYTNNSNNKNYTTNNNDNSSTPVNHPQYQPSPPLCQSIYLTLCQKLSSYPLFIPHNNNKSSIIGICIPRHYVND